MRSLALLGTVSLSLFLAAGATGDAFAQPVVTGTVLGPDQRPLAGARAELVPILPRATAAADPAPAAAIATDAAGRYALEAPWSGLWRVVIRNAGSPPVPSSPLPLVEPYELPPLSMAETSTTSQPKSATTSPPPSAAEPLVLSGQVIDATNRKPIPDALVWASADPGAFVRVDAEGRFRVRSPGRLRFDLEVLARGYLLRRVAILRPQLVSRKVGTLALVPAGKLQGRVVDLRGRPLARAAVLAVPLGALGARAFSPADPVTDLAMTGSQGRFDLRRVRPGLTYEIRASLNGWFPAAQHASAGDPTARPRDLTLVLAPARAARGKVQDPAGRSIAEAEVAARPALRPGSRVSGSADEDEVSVVWSDAQGVFSLPPLPAAEVELSVRRKGYAPTIFPSLRVAAGTGPVDLGAVVLRPGVTLAGRVIDHRGQAVPGSEVFLLDQAAGPNEMDHALKGRKPAGVAAADGRFSIDDLAQGAPAHVAVRAPGYLIAQVRAVRPPTARPLVIRLEVEAVLSGRVVNEAGEAVPGARIDLRWQASLPEEPDRPVGEPILRNARADGEGRFELRGLPSGPVRVGVTAPAFVPLLSVEVGLPRPANAGELRLVLERGALLQGRVTTATGEPVPAVRVGLGGAAASTEDDGMYWLEGAKLGRQEVRFLHPSYGRVAKPFEIQPGLNRLDVTLEPGVEVTGYVVDENAKPVPGARLDLASENRFELKQYRALTGDDGRFRFASVLAGRYRLRAGADGFTDTEHPEALVVASEPLSSLEVALDRGAVLAGKILGLPAEVLLQVEVEARSDRGEAVAAWTDGRGRYEVRSLAPGDWTVLARLWDDQRQAKVRVAIRRSDREVTRDLEFEERLALTVQVLYDDESLHDAQVSLRGQRITAERTATTDHEGRVRFDDLAPETYRLGLRHSRTMIVHNDQVELEQDRDLVISLQGATVGGLVVSAADGEPIADALLSLRPVEGPEYLVTTGTKSDGRFVVYRLQPNRYRLQANAKGFLLGEQELQVASGQTLDTVALRLEPAEGAKIRVRLSSGEVPSRVHLQVLDAAGRTVLAETQPADVTGEIELSSLLPGSWTLLLRGDASALARAGLLVPASEALVVTLPPAAKLSLRVPVLLTADEIGTVALFGPDGQPFWTIGPGGRVVQQWELIGGKAIVEGVPAGTWLLQVEAPDGQRWQSAAVTSGVTDLTVTLE